ncbi:MAG: S1 RNA-binding domain-containing protein, partial [Thermoplasmatales archaeon]
MRKENPEVGDIVVCTVKEVRDFGVVCTLDEFNNKEGFIHISEITSGWIKYIR